MDGKNDYIGEKILLSYISSVKKFEGHKPGRETKSEHDPTIFRYRISFLMLIYRFYAFVVFLIIFQISIFQRQKTWNSFGAPFVEHVSAAASAAAIISYDTISYAIISYDIISYDIISSDIISYLMISYDMIWYHIIWYNMIWYDIIWFDMIWYVVIWYDMIKYDIIEYDTIWCDMIDMI